MRFPSSSVLLYSVEFLTYAARGRAWRSSNAVKDGGDMGKFVGS